MVENGGKQPARVGILEGGSNSVPPPGSCVPCSSNKLKIDLSIRNDKQGRLLDKKEGGVT